MAEVSRAYNLDILHGIMPSPTRRLDPVAPMLPPGVQPRVITTLHGTDTTLLGHDKGYGPAIRHALLQSDAITTVSAFLKEETRKLFAIDRPIDVIHNFFAPRTPRRSRAEVRAELGVGAEVLILHCSNLRPVKRIDLLLDAAERIQPRSSFKLVILAGESFAPFIEDAPPWPRGQHHRAR